jgi:hypothetical protein
MPKNANDFVFAWLANGSTVDMNVDASGTIAYKYTVPSGKTLEAQRINFGLVDGAMTYGKFGGLTALTNGIKVEVLDNAGGTIIDFFNGQTVKSNEDFAALAGVDAIAEPAAGDDFMPIRWTIAKAGAAMRLQENEVIQLVLQDNLSNLSYFRAMIQGVFKE